MLARGIGRGLGLLRHQHQRVPSQVLAVAMRSPRHVKQAASTSMVAQDSVVVQTATKSPKERKRKVEQQVAELATATHIPVEKFAAAHVLQSGAVDAVEPAQNGAEPAADPGADSPAGAPVKHTPRKRGRKAAAEPAAKSAEHAAPREADAAPADAATPSKRTPRNRGEKVAAQPTANNEEAVAVPDADADAASGAAAADDAEAKPAKKKRAKKPVWPPGPLYNAAMRPPKHEGPAFRIISWNVAGLRGLTKRQPGALKQLAEAEEADVICLQETKLQDKHVEDAQEEVGLPGWSFIWNCSTALKGYSGTAMLSRVPPLNVTLGLDIDDHDQEGRVITAEFQTFFVVNVYTPNSGDGLRRLEYRTDRWDVDFAAYVSRLRERKPVIVTGDLNCAHMEIDIHEPKRNLRSAGFTEEERQSFTKCYMEAGMLDAFRRQHPGIVGYTYFSFRFNMRQKGKGWRLDYALVSKELEDQLHDCYHLMDVMGSDHVPVGLVLKLPQ